MNEPGDAGVGAGEPGRNEPGVTLGPDVAVSSFRPRQGSRSRRTVLPEGSGRALTRLNSRAPLVIDTHELPRRPGSMRRLTRLVPAPADLGVELIGVPEGADLELELMLESVQEGVLVSGTARAPLAGECARCLEPVSQRLEVTFQELFAYPGDRNAGESDEEIEQLEGDLLDLQPTLRDAVVLALPLAPVCRDDCPGLCPECGVRLTDAEPGHHHDAADPRWAALGEWQHDS